MSLPKVFAKIRNIAARCIVNLVNDGGGYQLLQINLSGDEVRSDIEHALPYGFSMVPLEGASGIALFYGGNRDHGTVINVSDARHRPTGLAAGEVILYHHDGAKIHFKNGGDIEVTAPGEVKLTASDFEFNGDVVVKGALGATQNITAFSLTDPIGLSDFKAKYNAHTHTEQGDGNPTSTTSDPL